tara:strand:- start:363 stop:1178 length:816 start_codon:yes stop_codon:yes gene_type:complete
MEELNEQNGEWDKMLEFITTEVLYRIDDGKYDPDNDEAPEFHPGSKRNKKCEIKKFLSEELSKMNFEGSIGKIFRELVLEMDTSNRRKKLIYRQQCRKIKELQITIRNHPEKMKTLEELLEVKEDQLKEKYEEKLAFGERTRQRANKQMERITQLNELVEEYRQNYVPKNDYEALRDTYTEEMLNAKTELAKAKRQKCRRSSQDKERKLKEKKKQEKIMKEKKKKMAALQKEMEEEQLRLEELISSDSDSSDSDSDVETLPYSVGSDSESE